MEKQIWKFKLQATDKMFIEMPKGAEVLSVQTQKDEPHMWAMVDPDAEKEERCFELFGTGHPVPCGMGVNRKFIGTFQLHNGNAVFHLFERLD